MLTRVGKEDRHYLQAAATARVLIMVFIAMGLRWREYGYCCCLLLLLLVVVVVCWCGGTVTSSDVLSSSCVFLLDGYARAPRCTVAFDTVSAIGVRTRIRTYYHSSSPITTVRTRSARVRAYAFGPRGT
eukprot:COSAG02_NODE_488_length_21256_cov_9.406579_9_plen_129_part_00